MPLTGEYEPSKSDWARKQAERFEATNGQEANTLRGDPIVVVTSLGAKSGKLRKTPIMRIEHEGQYVAVASLGGAPRNPQWYYNFKASPFVELQDGAVRRDYDVRELEGEERERWWRIAVEQWPTYAEYQRKTERQIPLLLLTPRD